MDEHQLETKHVSEETGGAVVTQQKSSLGIVSDSDRPLTGRWMDCRGQSSNRLVGLPQ